MKYAAIIIYASGERTGATIIAKDHKEAWQKLIAKLPMEYVQSTYGRKQRRKGILPLPS